MLNHVHLKQSMYWFGPDSAGRGDLNNMSTVQTNDVALVVLESPKRLV